MTRREAIRRTSQLLGGAALSATAVTAVMSGCQAPTATGWTPAYLTQDQSNLVAEITERIIPKTDTPGAKDALVHRFIDVYLKDLALAEDQLKFIAGLEDMEKRASDKFGKSFLKISNKDKDTILAAMESTNSERSDEEKAIELANEGESVRGGNVNTGEFIDGIKQLSLLGFFTSEIGATQVLKHDEIPGDYVGCLPYEEIGGVWSM